VTTHRLHIELPEAPIEPALHLAVAASEPPRYHALSVDMSRDEAELPWVHPIAGERHLPDKSDRRFGADRPGRRPGECGGGHCGVDLGRERGVVVHAALGGELIVVKRAASGRSGRYVAILHPQGLRTTYMHLDRVHPDLVEGMEIASGEAIGTVGTSGIQSSPPHLHFTVQRRSDRGWQYVDPEPMLGQATVLDVPAPLPEAPPRYSADLSRSMIIPPPPAPSGPSGPAAPEELLE
jgi:murein DD-endopeptidase MepM/ murein hydrolase activator NlpD